MLKLQSILLSCVEYVFVVLIVANYYVDGDVNSNSLKFFQQKEFHKPKTLSRQKILDIAALVDESRFKSILSNVLIPRDVGSEGHEQVKNYIIKFLSDLDWTVELDEFQQYIPSRNKDMNFTTVVSRLNEGASRYLVLACHYDSKYMKNQNFYGATDSAVPCAMLLDMASALRDYFKNYQSKDLSLMFVFFDGEEAFGSWGPTDSIYGAKHLARLWEQTPFEIDNANQLQRMDVLVLLDLLGARDPKFYYYSRDTRHLHYHLADTQNKLYQLDQLQDFSDQNKYFHKVRSYNYIEDDHLPFARATTPVPILHVIPEPFPGVWHTVDDNYKALHFPTINNLNKIFCVFTMSYLKGTLDDESLGKFIASNDCTSIACYPRAISWCLSKYFFVLVVWKVNSYSFLF